jgi:hypothetical protein
MSWTPRGWDPDPDAEEAAEKAREHGARGGAKAKGGRRSGTPAIEEIKGLYSANRAKYADHATARSKTVETLASERHVSVQTARNWLRLVGIPAKEIPPLILSRDRTR